MNVLRYGSSGVVVVGPPGVGKTRLVEEVLGALVADGRQVVRVYGSVAASSIQGGAFSGLYHQRAGAATEPSAIVAAVLQTLSAVDDRILLMVDDAHLLDEVSSVIVQQAVGCGAAQLVATVRAGKPMPDALHRMCQSGLVPALVLGGLAPEAIEALASEVLNGAVASHTLSTLWRLTGGNPLFLRELLLAALESDAISTSDGVLCFDDAPFRGTRMTDLLDARLRDTSVEERQALELLAIGEPLALPLLQELAGAEVVEALERRGLVEMRAGERIEACVSHPLYREVLRAGTPVTSRLRHSRRLADAAERSGVHPADLLRWAEWRLDGGGEVDPGLIIDAARRATARRVEPALRERIVRHAWDASRDPSMGVLLAHALSDVARVPEAQLLLDEVSTHDHSDRAAAEVATARSYQLSWGSQRMHEALSLVGSVEQSLAQPWRDYLRAHRSCLVAAAGCPTMALDLAEPLLQSDSLSIRRRAQVGAGMAYLMMGRFPDAERIGAEAGQIDVVVERGEVFVPEPGLLGTRIRLLGERGALAQAREVGLATVQSTISVGDSRGHAWAAGAMAAAELQAGRLTESRRYAAEAARYFRLVHAEAPRRWALATALAAAVHQRDTAAVERLAADIGPGVDLGADGVRILHSDVVRAQAWHLAYAGQLGLARQRLHDGARWWGAQGGSLAVVVFAFDIARLGDPASAAVLLDEVSVPAAWPLGEILAAVVYAGAAGAVCELEDLSRRLEELGYRLYAADVAAASAGYERRGTQNRDARRAGARALQRASAISAECGQPYSPLLDSLSDGGQLTTRERQIAQLAGDGASNRSIAKRLTLSERTVENHLSRVYAKLGVAGRTELSAALQP
jgi:DNA-binding CsgD family transcriptional regulator